ncbi:MAG TPA: nucleoside triphosphate pyrophosphohydrolase family protein [Candidatus Saccharimonadales bacterium]|nr:nucleoside triphosphate pyrophosphohydrolase family protein [Candidatus Saccharimonadales bacterium]
MTLDEYQQKALSTNINPGVHLFFDRLFGLVGEAGEMADKAKKWIRDDQADWDKLDKSAMMHELGDVLWYVATLADTLGYTFDEVAQYNLKKLADRHRRGKLSGNGDTR